MNKILSTLAIAGLAGSPLALAEIEGFSIKGKVDFESEYIFRGKEHSDENVQTKVIGEYALPTQGVNASIYAGAFLMSPISQAANEAILFTGVKTEVEKFLLEAGYSYYGYPNRRAAGATLAPAGSSPNPSGDNRAVYTDSHEVTLGGAYAGMKEIATPSLYFHYNFDLQQLTTEAAIRRSFKGDEYGIAGVELILAGFFGYVSARSYNGDNIQNGAGQWINSYGYVGGSVDIAYNVTNSAKIGTGIRYAYNNDGGASDDARLSQNTSSNLWYGIWAEFRY